MGNLKMFLGKRENVFLGKSAPNILFLGNTILGKVIHFWKNRSKIQEVLMRKIGYKGRCEKKSLSKSKEVCRTYDPIQSKYAELLDGLPEIEEIRCNVPLEGFKEGDYMTDFVCVKTDGDLMVRECVWRIMPQWEDIFSFAGWGIGTQELLYKFTNMEVPEIDSLCPESRKKAYERYTMIAPILRLLPDEHKKCEMISTIATNEKISKQTIRKYLCLYLAFQDIANTIW